MKSNLLMWTLPISIAAFGCASTPMPVERLASTQASIKASAEVGAQNDPQAALHLQYARDQLADAQRLIKKDENERAGYVLLRAEADADLALALAKAANLKTDAQNTATQAKAMRQQQQSTNGQ